jgi:hypothetical protein
MLPKGFRNPQKIGPGDHPVKEEPKVELKVEIKK